MMGVLMLSLDAARKKQAGDSEGEQAERDALNHGGLPVRGVGGGVSAAGGATRTDAPLAAALPEARRARARSAPAGSTPRARSRPTSVAVMRNRSACSIQRSADLIRRSKFSIALR